MRREIARLAEQHDLVEAPFSDVLAQLQRYRPVRRLPGRPQFNALDAGQLDAVLLFDAPLDIPYERFAKRRSNERLV
jgi:hypothetical protein